MTDGQVPTPGLAVRGAAVASAVIVVIAALATATGLSFTSPSITRTDAADMESSWAKRRSRSMEALAQSRLVMDETRVQADASVVVASEIKEGAETAVRTAEAELRAATTALAGVQRENPARQRSIADVSRLEQDLVAARRRLIAAQRDRVVASYTLDHEMVGYRSVAGHMGDFGPP